MAGRQEAGVIEYRPLREVDELRDLVGLQREVWGFEDIEIVPVRLFRVAVFVGGQVIGAYDGARLVGYCYSFPGVGADAGRAHLHSHMLAVLPEYRNQGVGRQLKLAQRSEALSRGINLVEWMFDPLETKNAYFNIERLGVVVRRYVPNAYGVTTSKLHTGMPTDRLIAEWRLATPRTEAIVGDVSRERDPVEARIPIPTNIHELRRHNSDKALVILQDARQKFEQHFAAGLTVTGIERSAETTCYTLSRLP